MTDREYICEIGRRMYLRQLVAANDGNISIRMTSGNIMITPTLASKGFMSPEELVITDIEGNILEGIRKPSSEIKMHLIVYKMRPEINAIVHAHPVVASAFAIVGRAIDQRYMPEAILTLGTIPVAPYAEPSTAAVAESIKPFINGYNGALLANHGAITWGRDLIGAYNLMEQLEFYCQTVITAESMGRPNPLP